ncbi:MAG: hypothetical protein HZC55_19505 [Verrucomicrobia bacterium]|nr:hypothetical protein [Verrucomicrobiota bacterium]
MLASLAAGAAAATPPAVPPPEIRFVAADPQGRATGENAADAADFRDERFWTDVRARLARGPVTVIFLSGTYVVSAEARRRQPPLRLQWIGHDSHPLVIEGERAGAVVFTRHSEDPDYSRTNNQGPGFLFLSGCRNVVVRRLRFTAPRKPISYATNFGGSRHLRIEDCHWHDLDGVYYGASGTAGAATSHVTFVRCRFERVGSGGHAHMVYNAYDPQHLRFVDCHFEDCAGDYLRFRDSTDFGVVAGCTFRSTGRFTGTHQAFIAVPLFNDDNPAAKSAHPNYEYFGTHFLFCHNRFIYEDEAVPANRTAVLFHHSGFDPPGRRHLLDARDAMILRTGTNDEKRTLLQAAAGINFTTVHVFANEYVRVAQRGAFRSKAAYGAKSRGGDGQYDISGLFNPEPVVRTPGEAAGYFDAPASPITGRAAPGVRPP